jgi:tRNA threonylcarbamoyladenosine biosynthesis protein TsaB
VTVVLGIDTATADAAIAVTADAEVLREISVPPGPDERPRHSQVLLGEIERCVDVAGGWDRVDRIAVGIGPGSFTGLRIGIATARALSQASETPIVPVGSLAALARGISAQDGERLALPVIDARRGEAFAALYEHDGTELVPPFVAGPDQLAERVAGLDRLALAAGDGALRFAAHLEAAGSDVAPPEDRIHRIAARHVCALGEAAVEVETERVEPLYLRPPDAKRWRERDGKAAGG